jgi:tetratricopeptide (TPR) repeat protein
LTANIILSQTPHRDDIAWEAISRGRHLVPAETSRAGTLVRGGSMSRQRPRAIRPLLALALALLALCAAPLGGDGAAGLDAPMADWLTQLGGQAKHVEALQAAGHTSVHALASLSSPEAALKEAGLGLKVRKKVLRALAQATKPPAPPAGGGAMPPGVRRAQALYSEGKLPEAAAAMRSAIEASPTDARLFANLGSILAAVNTGGHRSEAVEAFKQSLQLDPTQVKLRAQVVDMLASMGRTKEASALMEASGAGGGGGATDLASTLSVASAHRKLGRNAEALGTAAPLHHRPAPPAQPLNTHRTHALRCITHLNVAVVDSVPDLVDGCGSGV